MYPLCLYQFEYLRVICIMPEAFGVRQADLSVLNPLNEQIPSINAKIIFNVKESNPAPAEVLYDANNRFYDLFIGMHCSQERWKLRFC